MTCPYCQSEMQLGYLQSRDGLFWTPKRQLIASLSFLGKGRVPLWNGAEDEPYHKTVYAFHCPTCKVVIIPHGDQLSPE